MPRSDDQSDGDARRPYADEGGPEGHHARSHDVRREEATRPRAHDDTDDFADDLVAEHSGGGHTDESLPASDDKELRTELAELDADELKRLSILTVGTRLDQGSTYMDLNDLGGGPFTAMGNQETGDANRYVAKRDTDYELWDRLVGLSRAAAGRPPNGT